jgi:ketosteroid isomerase-like protein
VSDVVRRRIAALLLVAGTAVAVLAIEDVGPFEDPVTEEERATAAVQDFFNAASEGDSKRFCALLTADAREQLRVSTAQRLQTDEVPACTKILDVLAPVFADSQFTLRYVSVSGNRARAEGRFKVGDAPAQPRTVLLLLERGEWHVSDPG